MNYFNGNANQGNSSSSGFNFNFSNSQPQQNNSNFFNFNNPQNSQLAQSLVQNSGENSFLKRNFNDSMPRNDPKIQSLKKVFCIACSWII